MHQTDRLCGIGTIAAFSAQTPDSTKLNLHVVSFRRDRPDLNMRRRRNGKDQPIRSFGPPGNVDAPAIRQRHGTRGSFQPAWLRCHPYRGPAGVRAMNAKDIGSEEMVGPADHAWQWLRVNILGSLKNPLHGYISQHAVAPFSIMIP